MKKALKEEMSTGINQLRNIRLSWIQKMCQLWNHCNLMIDIIEKHHQEQKKNGKKINVISSYINSV